MARKNSMVNSVGSGSELVGSWSRLAPRRVAGPWRRAGEGDREVDPPGGFGTARSRRLKARHGQPMEFDGRGGDEPGARGRCYLAPGGNRGNYGIRGAGRGRPKPLILKYLSVQEKRRKEGPLPPLLVLLPKTVGVAWRRTERRVLAWRPDRSRFAFWYRALFLPKVATLATGTQVPALQRFARTVWCCYSALLAGSPARRPKIVKKNSRLTRRGRWGEGAV